EDGYFWWVGRSDEMIKSRGYKVAPFEVESAILEHEAVKDAGVIGVPDPVKGQSLRAYVSLRPGFAASEELAESIRRHVRETIAPYKVPDRVEFMDELPKTATGKI